MEIGIYWIKTPKGFYGSIHTWFGLFSERAKHPIKDDKDSPMVFVDVDRIDRMVHPVVGRSGKDVFSNLSDFANGLGMDPKLVNQIDS